MDDVGVVDTNGLTRPGVNQAEPTEEDFRALWAINPVAAEQLVGIVLRRLLRDRDDELAAVRSKLASLTATANDA